MLHFAYSHSSPAFNLAMEEVLLEPMVKVPDSPALFRVWHNQQKCVVIGRGEKIDQRVHLTHAKTDQIPVFRRVSGGGTVLHGPDNINLSFFLPFSHHSSLSNLKDSYRYILSWVQQAIFQSHQIKIDINGSSDLVIENKKFSGTAQARKRHGLLHHMTLLLKADYAGMEKYLIEPDKRPEYRQRRVHQDFVIGLKDHTSDFNLESFLNALKNILGVHEAFSPSPELFDKVNQLAEKKYCLQQWNHEGKLP